MNRNVFLNILLAGTSGVADSVWSGTVFVAFLYTLTNDSNSKVGYVEAMQGASQLASALPVGYPQHCKRIEVVKRNRFKHLKCPILKSSIFVVSKQVSTLLKHLKNISLNTVKHITNIEHIEKIRNI